MDGALKVTLIVIATLVASEVMLRLPFHKVIRHLFRYVEKARLILLSKKISENWKEKVLPVYAGKIFMASLKLFAFILVVLSPFVAVGLLFPMGYPGLIKSLSRIKVSVGIMGIALGYMFIRKKLL